MSIHWDAGIRNDDAPGGRGAWVDDVTGAKIENQIGGALMSDKLVLVNNIRNATKSFNDAWRNLKPMLEDVTLLGFDPAGSDPITDADLANESITATQFFAGLAALAALDSAPTTEQVKSLAKLAARK